MEKILLTEIPIVETGNYILRGMDLIDASSLLPVMSHKETMKYITPHPVKTKEEMEKKIANHLRGFEKQKEIPWVIIDRENEEIVGMFRFHKLHLWHRKAEMGAVIRQEYQKKGVMTEILTTVLPYAFHQLNLNRVVGDIFEGNRGSQRLLEKFHFRKEGQLRQTDFDGENYHDTIVYSLLKSEYESI
ncbi:MAG: GNAT family N-acetyltransferase [Bacillus sp. (in: Bacteria)]|nr:GNAT family N-acetyltransferase [Bacillus sp. (in: firmicutes)]